MVGYGRYHPRVIVKCVTTVVLSRTTERSGLTAHPGTDLWRVDWTEDRNGKTVELRQSHYTEAAARKHNSGLLSMRVEGLSSDDVYAERL